MGSTEIVTLRYLCDTLCYISHFLFRYIDEYPHFGYEGIDEACQVLSEQADDLVEFISTYNNQI